MPEHQQTQQSTESKTTSQKQTIPRIHAPISHPMAIIQRARMNPKSLTHADVLQLQSTIGNRAVGRLLSEIGLIPSKAKRTPPVQMQTIPEEEKEPLQGKVTGTIQRQEPEEDENLQMKSVVQRQELPEDKELLQGKFESKLEQSVCPSCIQRKELEEEEPLQTKRENYTGMPDNLKAGVESLSGIDMSDVKVHYNSSKPAEVGALAYTQGTNIHVAPGQERHLPHEAWHVVQQAQGRVRPTMQLKGVAVNDDSELEREADVMGGKVLKSKHDQDSLLGKCTMTFRRFSSSPLQMCLHNSKASICSMSKKTAGSVIQRIIGEDYMGIWAERRNANGERIYYQVFKYDPKSKNYILYDIYSQHTEVGYNDPNYFRSKGPVGPQYFESRSAAAATTSPPVATKERASWRRERAPKSIVLAETQATTSTAPPLPRDSFEGLAAAPARLLSSQVPSSAKDKRREERRSASSERVNIIDLDVVRPKGQGTAARAYMKLRTESLEAPEYTSDIRESGHWSDQPDYYYQFVTNDFAGGDAEVKVLSDITSKIDEFLGYEEGCIIRGTVILQTSQGPCRSCRDVIQQFHTDHPGVLLIVQYRQEKVQIQNISNTKVGGMLGYMGAEKIQGLWVKIFKSTI